MRTTAVYALLLVTFTQLVNAASANSAQSTPNVVMIISDDQGWTDFGFMGHDEIQTPHLDQLASQSAVFANGYVPSSLCRPSLATMITGLYPHQHLILGNDPRGKVPREQLAAYLWKQPTLPKLLAAKSYLSQQTGKWWEGDITKSGFTHGPANTNRHGSNNDPQGLRIGRNGMQPIFDFLDEAQKQEKTFFLWYAPFLPHTPHNPPARLLQKYQRDGRPLKLAKYFAMCEWFDETCGQLLSYLDDHQLSENTLVCFVVDNGWTSGGAIPGSHAKRSPFDGGVRTPILLRWPGKIAAGRREDLVSSVDLAPTILAACDVEAPSDLPGLNLMDLLADKAPPRETVFGECYEHDVLELGNPAASLRYRWCRHGDWKLIVGQNSKQLFHLRDDPHEAHDLSKQQPDRVAALEKVLDAWWNPGNR